MDSSKDEAMPPKDPPSVLDMVNLCTDTKTEAMHTGPEEVDLNDGIPNGDSSPKAVEADAVSFHRNTLDGLYWGLLHKPMEDLLSHEASMAGQSVGW